MVSKKNKKGKKEETQKRVRRILPETELVPNEASRGGVYVFSLALFVLGFVVTFLLAFSALSLMAFFVAAVVGLALMACIRIAPHWERVAVLRLGKFNRVVGPGVYCCIPLVEYAAIHVDQRIKTTSFSAEAALTADLVPVDVDAILFWMVWDAKKACLEVDNYPKAVLWSAQTAMRDAIGQLNLSDISLRRKQLDRELEETLGKKCEQWGISVLSVEIRDIMIPDELQGALSREAQAERERNARIMLAEVEKEISEMFVEAAEVYDKSPKAIQLRAMNLAYDGMRDGKGVLLMPSALSDSFDMSKLFRES